MKLALLSPILLALALSAVGQSPAKDAPIKWTALNGKNKEFVVSMPVGYQSANRPDMNQRAPKVTLHNTTYRYINGVVLMMEYFEGDPKEIQDHLIRREKLTDVTPESFGDFAVKRFSKVSGKQTIKINHFALKDRLYVIRSYSDTDNDPISTAFFQSVRLITTTGSVALNESQGAKETILPNLVETVAPADDAQIFLPKDVDREAIVIHKPRPLFPLQEMRGFGEWSIKLESLLSSSGKVTRVKIVSSSSKALEQAAIEAAKKAIFIPAQKDGRLVATYYVTQYMGDSR